VGQLSLVAVAWFCVSGTTPAQAPSVVILRPANSAPVMVETLVRLKGELTSAGFDTEIVDVPVTRNTLGNARADLEHLAVQRRAQAVVAIVGDLSPESVEVWVVDNVTGKSSVRRVSFESGAAPAAEALAIRAIELLRSSFLEIEWATDGRQSQPGGETPPVVVKSVENERLARRADKLGVEVGGAAITSLSGIGPALVPLLRFDWSLHPSLLAQVTFAGLGTRPSVDSNVGSADISQEFGLLGGQLCFRSGKRLRPCATLAAGVLHTSVAGHADAPNDGRAMDQWSFLVDAGMGALLRLPDRFFLALAAHLQLAEPYPMVRFVGNVVATSARPNLLLTVTVGAWL